MRVSVIIISSAASAGGGIVAVAFLALLAVIIFMGWSEKSLQVNEVASATALYMPSSSAFQTFFQCTADLRRHSNVSGEHIEQLVSELGGRFLKQGPRYS